MSDAALAAPSRTTRRVLGHVAATIVVLVSGAMQTGPGPGAELAWEPGVLVLNLVVVAVLLFRHRFPFVVLLVVVALVLLSVPLGLFNPGTVTAAAIATYSATLRAPRGPGAAGTALVSATMFASAWIAGEPAPQHALAVLLGGAIGDAIRTQRSHVASITERAERAERTREALARQRVAEDRLAIARDLHDVVAHQIAVINLHAGVASSALRSRPDDAEASLTVIRRASRTVLTEIGDLMATLRDPASADTGPVGLAQLDDVVRSFAGDGLEVTVRTEGTRYDLPGTTDVTALRVVQEALANAHKHGTLRRAHVLVEYRARSLRLTIANPFEIDATSGDAAGGPLGTRQGLTGMNERVESVRGTLTYGPDGTGTWLLVADLPTDPDAGPDRIDDRTGTEGRR